MSFSNFTSGDMHSFGGEYLGLIPGTLIVHADKFDGLNLPAEMKTTIRLQKVSCGTDINIVREGVPRPAVLRSGSR
jgi:hypothetical protein